MADFTQALTVILEHEGSAFVDHPLDGGGPTRYGITIRTLSSYLGRPATVAEVQALTVATVAPIYRRFYWGLVKGDDIRSQGVATAFVDMAVLFGPAQAGKLAQEVVGAVTDGIVGPKTIAALNAYDPTMFLWRFAKRCTKTFLTIVAQKPSQLVFLPIWINRVDDMTDFKGTSLAS